MARGSLYSIINAARGPALEPSSGAARSRAGLPASRGCFWGDHADAPERVPAQLDPKLQRSVAVSVARGMAYLHTRSPPILHLDLKSPNILVDDRWRVKIADFGLSRVRHRTFVSSSAQVGAESAWGSATRARMQAHARIGGAACAWGRMQVHACIGGAARAWAACMCMHACVFATGAGMQQSACMYACAHACMLHARTRARMHTCIPCEHPLVVTARGAYS